MATGRIPNTENIGLEALGVKTTKGHIDTDPMCRTNVPGLWAIGDVTAPPWLAHKASHEGVTAAEAIAKELGNKDAHPHATAMCSAAIVTEPDRGVKRSLLRLKKRAVKPSRLASETHSSCPGRGSRSERS